jgi:hypothetical protein
MRQRIVLFRFRKRGALPPSPLGRLPRSIFEPDKRISVGILTTFAQILDGSGATRILGAEARIDAFSQQLQLSRRVARFFR